MQVQPDEAWTADEEQVIVQGHREHGDKWQEIAQLLPGRTEAQVKSYWDAAMMRSDQSDAPLSVYIRSLQAEQGAADEPASQGHSHDNNPHPPHNNTNDEHDHAPPSDGDSAPNKQQTLTHPTRANKPTSHQQQALDDPRGMQLPPLGAAAAGARRPAMAAMPMFHHPMGPAGAMGPMGHMMPMMMPHGMMRGPMGGKPGLMPPGAIQIMHPHPMFAHPMMHPMFAAPPPPHMRPGGSAGDAAGADGGDIAGGDPLALPQNGLRVQTKKGSGGINTAGSFAARASGSLAPGSALASDATRVEIGGTPRFGRAGAVGLVQHQSTPHSNAVPTGAAAAGQWAIVPVDAAAEDGEAAAADGAADAGGDDAGAVVARDVADAQEGADATPAPSDTQTHAPPPRQSRLKKENSTTSSLHGALSVSHMPHAGPWGGPAFVMMPPHMVMAPPQMAGKGAAGADDGAAAEGADGARGGLKKTKSGALQRVPGMPMGPMPGHPWGQPMMMQMPFNHPAAAMQMMVGGPQHAAFMQMHGMPPMMAAGAPPPGGAGAPPGMVPWGPWGPMHGGPMMMRPANPNNPASPMRTKRKAVGATQDGFSVDGQLSARVKEELGGGYVSGGEGSEGEGVGRPASARDAATADEEDGAAEAPADGAARRSKRATRMSARMADALGATVPTASGSPRRPARPSASDMEQQRSNNSGGVLKRRGSLQPTLSGQLSGDASGAMGGDAPYGSMFHQGGGTSGMGQGRSRMAPQHPTRMGPSGRFYQPDSTNTTPKKRRVNDTHTHDMDLEAGDLFGTLLAAAAALESDGDSYRFYKDDEPAQQGKGRGGKKTNTNDYEGYAGYPGGEDATPTRRRQAAGRVGGGGGGSAVASPAASRPPAGAVADRGGGGSRSSRETTGVDDWADGGANGGVGNGSGGMTDPIDGGVGTDDPMSDMQLVVGNGQFAGALVSQPSLTSSQRRGGVGSGALMVGGPQGGPKSKTSWSKLESDLLCKFVEAHGGSANTTPWTFVAHQLNEAMREHYAKSGYVSYCERTSKQCRERWIHNLAPHVCKDAWTESENATLADAHRQFGNQWSRVARLLQGRTENTVKNHWNATLRRKQPARLPGGGISALDVYMVVAGLKSYDPETNAEIWSQYAHQKTTDSPTHSQHPTHEDIPLPLATHTNTTHVADTDRGGDSPAPNAVELLRSLGLQPLPVALAAGQAQGSQHTNNTTVKTEGATTTTTTLRELSVPPADDPTMVAAVAARVSYGGIAVLHRRASDPNANSNLPPALLPPVSMSALGVAGAVVGSMCGGVGVGHTAPPLVHRTSDMGASTQFQMPVMMRPAGPVLSGGGAAVAAMPVAMAPAPQDAAAMQLAMLQAAVQRASGGGAAGAAAGGVVYHVVSTGGAFPAVVAGGGPVTLRGVVSGGGAAMP